MNSSAPLGSIPEKFSLPGCSVLLSAGRRIWGMHEPEKDFCQLAAPRSKMVRERQELVEGMALSSDATLVNKAVS